MRLWGGSARLNGLTLLPLLTCLLLLAVVHAAADGTVHLSNEGRLRNPCPLCALTDIRVTENRVFDDGDAVDDGVDSLRTLDRVGDTVEGAVDAEDNRVGRVVGDELLKLLGRVALGEVVRGRKSTLTFIPSP